MGADGQGGAMAGKPAGNHVVAGPRQFDAYAASERRLALRGSIDPREFPRVDETLAAEGSGEVAWCIAGAVDALGRPALDVQLDGRVPLVCQRCLLPFVQTVTQRTLLLLARNERELASLDEQEEHEVVLADRPLDVLELVEEELLLTLPYVPRCADPACATGAEAREVPVAAASPFAALAGLGKAAGRKRRN
jgi:uncharacterized protein